MMVRIPFTPARDKPQGPAHGSTIPPSPARLVADQPIQSADEDRLDRSGLVKALASTIERAPTSGFVVGLSGPWGEGKSSVLNMVANRLETRGTAQVVRFNPWLFSGSNDLLFRFLSELAAQIKISGRAGARAAKALGALGGGLNRLGPIPLIGGVLEAGGTMAQGAAKLIQAGTSIEAHRVEVAKALMELDRPIVVIVDDVDRLQQAEEIAEVMRLIRLVGDLPRVTYLVAYERTVVALALGDNDVHRGEAYLEKIIQTGFELPATRRDILDRLLSEAIAQAVGDLEDHRFDSSRFQILQIAGFNRLFSNVRDVRRFASALPAVLSAVSGELELSDVLALEAIRVLEPKAYEAIAANAEALTSISRDGLDLDGRRSKQQESNVKATVEAGRNAQVVSDLIKELFPAGGRFIGGMNYSSSFTPVWRREGRVAAHDNLLIYLERGLPEGSISTAQVRRALDDLNDRERLDRLLNDTDETQLIRLLSRLEDYDGEFEIRNPHDTVGQLAAAASRLRPRETFGFRYDAGIAVSRLLIRVLRGLSQEELEGVLTSTQWPDLSTQFEVVRMVGHRKDTGSGLVSPELAAKLEAALVDAVLAAPTRQLRDEPDLGHLLWVAEDADHARTRRRLEELISDPLLLCRWLSQTMWEKRAGDQPVYMLPWSRLVRSVDAARLTEMVGALDDSWIEENLNGREREAVRQARHYAENPESAEADLQAFTRGAAELP
jgi:predicted KAP-like P-loop ATPase